jgi:hypothetical protein
MKPETINTINVAVESSIPSIISQIPLIMGAFALAGLTSYGIYKIYAYLCNNTPTPPDSSDCCSPVVDTTAAEIAQLKQQLLESVNRVEWVEEKAKLLDNLKDKILADQATFKAELLENNAKVLKAVIERTSADVLKSHKKILETATDTALENMSEVALKQSEALIDFNLVKIREEVLTNNTALLEKAIDQQGIIKGIVEGLANGQAVLASEINDINKDMEEILTESIKDQANIKNNFKIIKNDITTINDKIDRISDRVVNLENNNNVAESVVNNELPVDQLPVVVNPASLLDPANIEIAVNVINTFLN